MAALSITVASVASVAAGAIINKDNLAGETITAGQSVYLKSTDSRWWLAQADGTAQESGSGVTLGVALHASLAGQPVAVQTGGDITIGATILVAVEYYVHTTAGGIGPVADIGTTNYLSIVGYGVSTTVLRLLNKATGFPRA